jgi:hypothetical protein
MNIFKYPNENYHFPILKWAVIINIVGYFFLEYVGEFEQSSLLFSMINLPGLFQYVGSLLTVSLCSEIYSKLETTCSALATMFGGLVLFGFFLWPVLLAEIFWNFGVWVKKSKSH